MSPSSSKNNLSIVPWILLLSILCLICVILGAAPGVLTFLMDNRPFGSSTKTQTPLANGQPTPAPRVTNPPSQSASTLENPQNAFGTFVDDFSNPTSGWIIAENNMYNIGYSKEQDYLLKIMDAGRFIFLTPPDGLTLPFKNVTIKVEVKQENIPGSSYGVMCRIGDNNSYYAVEVREREYKITKIVMGQETALTIPEWKRAGNIEFVDSRGFAHMTVKCSGDAISVDFNGQTQPAIMDAHNPLLSGNVAIFGRGSTTVKSGLSNQVSFDNFSLVVSP
jgi:hypothetical protein